MKTTNLSIQHRLYICSIVIILFAALLWIWYNHRYVPMRHAQAILEFIEEGTYESMRSAGAKIAGVDWGRGERIEDHQPLKGKYAEVVKQSLLNTLSTADDRRVLGRTLGIFARWPSDRTGLEITSDEEWRIVEEAAEKFNKSPDDDRFFKVVITDEGKKALAHGARLNHGDMPRREAVKD